MRNLVFELLHFAMKMEPLASLDNKHLNVSQRITTSQLIANRITQEAKILLKHSIWNVAEIGFALGFQEATHVSSFF